MAAVSLYQWIFTAWSSVYKQKQNGGIFSFLTDIYRVVKCLPENKMAA
jgi:hypothetical protein